jgi:hypothetical protein
MHFDKFKPEFSGVEPCWRTIYHEDRPDRCHCYFTITAREPSSSLILPTMVEQMSKDGRKRRLIYPPGNERRRTCCGEDCELASRVQAQETEIGRLADRVEVLLGRLRALEKPPSSASRIDHARAAASNRHSCPADKCAKAFERTDHLHRHIRSINDEPHRRLARRLDEKYCSGCKKGFKRPCDLVRHEKSFHNEKYKSRAYKFASNPARSVRTPTPTNTSSNPSVDGDDLASE